MIQPIEKAAYINVHESLTQIKTFLFLSDGPRTTFTTKLMKLKMNIINSNAHFNLNHVLPISVSPVMYS